MSRIIIGMNYSGEIYEHSPDDLLEPLLIYWSPSVIAGVRIRNFRETGLWTYARESDVPKEFLTYCLLVGYPCVFYRD